MKNKICIAAASLCLYSCELHEITTDTIKLESNEKLIGVGWSNAGSLWYLVEPMDSDYVPKVKVFKSELNGRVTFIEKR